MFNQRRLPAGSTTLSLLKSTPYPKQELRGLSPITELTTPASSRSNPFPAVSDREYASDFEDGITPSPRSYGSGQTVLAGLQESLISPSPSLLSPMQSPLLPLGSPLYGHRPYTPETSSLLPSLPTPPTTARSDGTLQSHMENGALDPDCQIEGYGSGDRTQGASAMASEKADGPLSTRPRLDRRNLRISTVSPEEEDEKSTSGIAGVGAGGTREMVFDVKAFGRMSLPNGFQGEHEPILVKTRPVTYHGEEHEHVLDALEDDFPLGMASLDEIQTAAIQRAQATPPRLRYQHVSHAAHRSEASLPLTSHNIPSSTSASPPTPTGKTSLRVWAASNMLMAFLGVDPSDSRVSERVVHRLSKRRRRSGTRVTAARPPRPASPVASDGTATGAAGSPKTAIRTSGTFGIRDDGSEVFSAGQYPPTIPVGSPTLRGKSRSGDGSVRSLPPREVLYVENFDDSISEVDEPVAMARDPSSFGLSPVEPVPVVGSEDSHEGRNQQQERFQSRSALRKRSLSTPSAAIDALDVTHVYLQPDPPLSAPARSRHHVRGASWSSGFVEDGHSTRFQMSNSDIPAVPVSRQSMVDRSMQTSAASSPRRPLPRPPNGINTSQTSLPGTIGSQLHTRDSQYPQIHFPLPPPASSSDHRSSQPPPLADRSPESSQASSDLPLLIASHLLATHATSLMRHSTSMKDASHEMERIARESLRWGEVLMGMTRQDSGHDGHPGGLYAATGQGGPRHSWRDVQQVISPVDQAFTKLSTRPFSLPAVIPGQVELDNLTSLPPRPTHARSITRSRPPIPPRAPTGSLPADWPGESDRLECKASSWNPPRRGGDSWMSAMSSLREILDLAEDGRVRPSASVGGEASRTRVDSMTDDRVSFGEHEDRWSRQRSEPPSRSTSHLTNVATGQVAQRLGTPTFSGPPRPQGTYARGDAPKGGRRLSKRHGPASPSYVQVKEQAQQTEQARRHWWSRRPASVCP